MSPSPTTRFALRDSGKQPLKAAAWPPGQILTLGIGERQGSSGARVRIATYVSQNTCCVRTKTLESCDGMKPDLNLQDMETSEHKSQSYGDRDVPVAPREIRLSSLQTAHTDIRSSRAKAWAEPYPAFDRA